MENMYQIFRFDERADKPLGCIILIFYFYRNDDINTDTRHHTWVSALRASLTG